MFATSLYVPLLSFIPAYIEYTRICDENSGHTLMTLVGLGPSQMNLVGILSAALQGAMPIAVLFTGSIMAGMLNKGTEVKQNQRRKGIAWIRDLFASPLMEEVCFRSGLVSYLHLRRWAFSDLVLGSPVFFAISHVHHMYENVYIRGMLLSTAGIVAAFQCAYTYVFGCVAVFLFISTGSLIAPVVAHMLCNYFGFPRFGDIWRYNNARMIAAGHVCGVFGFLAMVHHMAHRPMQYPVQSIC